MRALIDTANLDELRQAVAYGFFRGVTTNPKLIRKETEPARYHEHILRIREIFSGEIFIQVIGSTAEEMVRQAQEISRWTTDVVVKLPLNEEGIRAVSQLRTMDSIKTCMTVTFSPTQALIAAMAGADYVAPFFKRVNAATGSGEYVIRELAELFRAAKVETRIIGASVETPMDVVTLVKAGADVVTAPLAVWTNMIRNALSDEVLSMFLNDWKGNEI